MYTGLPHKTGWKIFTSDCSVLQVTLHHSVPKFILAHNVISQNHWNTLTQTWHGWTQPNFTFSCRQIFTKAYIHAPW